MPDQRMQWYSDDEDVLAKVEYNNRWALVVTTPTATQPVEIIDTRESTEYAFIVNVDGRWIEVMKEGGAAGPFLSLMGELLAFLLKETDNNE